MDQYIDPRDTLIEAATAMLDTGDFDQFPQGMQERLTKALRAVRWHGDDESLRTLAARYKNAYEVQLERFRKTICERGYDGSHLSATICVGVTEDGRISVQGSGLAPHPDLYLTYSNGWSLGGHVEPRKAMHVAIVHEHNVTQDFDVKRLTDDNYKHANWQVIFKTKEGLDYCRETYMREFHPIEEVEATAVQGIKQHGLGGAVIQLW